MVEEVGPEGPLMDYRPWTASDMKEALRFIVMSIMLSAVNNMM